MNKDNKENLPEVIKNILFEPLMRSLQDMKSDFSDFIYINERFNMTAVTYCQQFLIKFELEISDINPNTYEGVNVKIYSRDLEPIDKQIVYFKEVLNIISKNKKALPVVNRSQDMTDSIEDIVTYVEQWFLFTDILETNH